MGVLPRGEERGKGQIIHKRGRGERGEREREKIRERGDQWKDWCLNMDSELN